VRAAHQQSVVGSLKILHFSRTTAFYMCGRGSDFYLLRRKRNEKV
jgi:hypothetical protein